MSAEVVVPAALAGERVDRAIALLSACSRSEAVELLEQGSVRIGGTVVTQRSRRLVVGELLELPDAIHHLPALPDVESAVEFRVVHEDDEIIVVDKPAGLVVHPGAGNRSGTLVAGLLARYPDLAALAGEGEGAVRPGIVHRLDRDTSGLLVVARTEAARRSIIAQLAAREVERRYRALARGSVAADEGVIDAPLGRSRQYPTRMAVSAEGRPARTHYRVLQRFSEPLPASYLELSLETGRTHQIRVHLSAIDHPVLGDPRYGGRRKAPPTRTFLHAWRLSFEHPATGQQVAFEAPLPDDLVEVLARFS